MNGTPDKSEHVDPVLGALRRDQFFWTGQVTLPRLGSVPVRVFSIPIAPKQHEAFRMVVRYLESDFASIENAIVANYRILQTVFWPDERVLPQIANVKEIWNLLSEPYLHLPDDYPYFDGPIGVLSWYPSWDCERCMYAVIVENSCIGASTDSWTTLMDDWVQAR